MGSVDVVFGVVRSTSARDMACRPNKRRAGSHTNTRPPVHPVRPAPSLSLSPWRRGRP